MKHLLIFFVLLLSACESDYTAPRTSEEIMECIRDADNDAYRAEVQFKDGDDYNNITQDVYFPEKGYNRSIYEWKIYEEVMEESTENPGEFIVIGIKEATVLFPNGKVYRIDKDVKIIIIVHVENGGFYDSKTMTGLVKSI